jgi:hypothetical protein
MLSKECERSDKCPWGKVIKNFIHFNTIGIERDINGRSKSPKSPHGRRLLFCLESHGKQQYGQYCFGFLKCCHLLVTAFSTVFTRILRHLISLSLVNKYLMNCFS